MLKRESVGPFATRVKGTLGESQSIDVIKASVPVLYIYCESNFCIFIFRLFTPGKKNFT